MAMRDAVTPAATVQTLLPCSEAVASDAGFAGVFLPERAAGEAALGAAAAALFGAPAVGATLTLDDLLGVAVVDEREDVGADDDVEVAADDGVVDA